METAKAWLAVPEGIFVGIFQRVHSGLHSRLLVPGVMVAALALTWSLFSPAFDFLLAGVCPQRPSHSLFIGDEPMPLEARMLGIYGGVTVAFVCLMMLRDKVPAQTLPLRVLGIIPIGLLITGLDGGNAFLSDLGMPHPYPPINQLRFLTGALAGMSVGVMVLPFIALFSTPRYYGDGRWRRVLGWLLVTEGAFVAMVFSGIDMLVTLALAIAIAGIIGLFWVATGLTLAWVVRRLRPPIRLDAVLPFSLCLAFAELALLALLRTWLQDQLGVVWL